MPEAKVLQWLLASYALHSGHSKSRKNLCQRGQGRNILVRETDAGIVVRGPRVLATLGPLADEIAVYPARNHELPPDAQGHYSFAFAIPCNTLGVKFLCRESFDLGCSHFDHPLAHVLKGWTPLSSLTTC
jgi:hypothetical protein